MTFEQLLLTSLTTQLETYLGLAAGSGTDAFTREIVPAFNSAASPQLEGFRFRLADRKETGLNTSLTQVDTKIQRLYLDTIVNQSTASWSDYNDQISLFFRKPPFNIYTPPAPDPSSPYQINSVVIWDADPPQYDHPQGFAIRRYYLVCDWQYV